MTTDYDEAFAALRRVEARQKENQKANGKRQMAKVKIEEADGEEVVDWPPIDYPAVLDLIRGAAGCLIGAGLGLLFLHHVVGWI